MLAGKDDFWNPSAGCCTDVLKASPVLLSAAGWSNAVNTHPRGCWVGGMLGHPVRGGIVSWRGKAL